MKEILYLLLGSLLTTVGALVQDYIKSSRQRKQRFKNLLAELEDTSTLIQHYQLGGGIAKARLDGSMWDLAKGELTALPVDLQNLLRKIYVAVARFNCLVDYDLEFGGPGTGKFDTVLGVTADEIKSNLPDAVDKLRTYLAKKSQFLLQ